MNNFPDFGHKFDNNKRPTRPTDEQIVDNFLREMAGDPATEFGFVEAVLEFLGSVFAIHLMEMDESPVTDHAMQIIYDEFKSSKNVMGAAVEVANYIRENS